MVHLLVWFNKKYSSFLNIQLSIENNATAAVSIFEQFVSKWVSYGAQ